jgi:hypothetical protein
MFEPFPATPIYDQLRAEQEQRRCTPETQDDTGPDQPNATPDPQTGEPRRPDPGPSPSPSPS